MQKISSSPKAILIGLLRRTASCWSDKVYLKMIYCLTFGKKLDLNDPKTFNEKLQWLKLYNRRPEYTMMVDKYAVKEYISNQLGEQYIIPTLGVWNSWKEIDFDELPDQFVIKTTHGGGNTGVVVCTDKATFDIMAAKQKITQSMKSDIYKTFREWPYKDVPKKIIVEQYMSDKSCPDKAIVDYKFSCYNGKAYKVMMCLGRETGNTKFYSFNRQWELLRHNRLGKSAPKGFTLPKPQCMDEMFLIADKLSQGLPFVRVDLYCVNNQIYFGELTFFPASGLDSNILPEIDLLYGSMLELPPQKR